MEETLQEQGVRGTIDRNHPPWPDTIVTPCRSYLTTGGPGKEHGTNKLPPTRRIWERSKGERKHQSICPTNLPESLSLECILAEWCVHHQEGPWVRMMGQRQSGNWPHYHKTWDCEPHGRAVLLVSLTLLLSAPVPLPSKVSCFVSTCVSSDNSFPSVKQEPTPGPWKKLPFLQQRGCPFLCCHASPAGFCHARLCQHPDLVAHAASPTPSSCRADNFPGTWFIQCTVVSSSQWQAAFPSNPLGKFYSRMLLARYHLCLAFPFSNIPEGRFVVNSTSEASQWLCCHPVIHRCDLPNKAWISALEVGEGFSFGHSISVPGELAF